MFLKISYAILTTCIFVQISVAQTTYLKNDNPFSSGASNLNSDGSSSGFILDSSSSPQLNKENSQLLTQPSTSCFQEPFPSGESSSVICSSDQISPVSNQSPIESFVNEFSAAVYSSKALQEIFDLRDLSAEAFSKSLYDYVYSICVESGHSDPHYIASMASSPIKEGIDSYSLPVMLDIYSNAAAKYLFAQGSLSLENAPSLAREFAKFMEESTEQHWAKDTPESKFLAIEEGFNNFLKSFDHFKVDTFKDVAFHYSNEVKRVANKS